MVRTRTSARRGDASRRRMVVRSRAASRRRGGRVVRSRRRRGRRATKCERGGGDIIDSFTIENPNIDGGVSYTTQDIKEARDQLKAKQSTNIDEYISTRTEDIKVDSNQKVFKLDMLHIPYEQQENFPALKECVLRYNVHTNRDYAVNHGMLGLYLKEIGETDEAKIHLEYAKKCLFNSSPLFLRCQQAYEDISAK